MTIIVKKPNEAEKAEMSTKPVWECGVSEFDWHYDSEETCLLIEGDVTVSYGGGFNTPPLGELVDLNSFGYPFGKFAGNVFVNYAGN